MGIMHSFSQRGAVVVNLDFGVKHYCHFMLHFKMFYYVLINMSCFMHF